MARLLIIVNDVFQIEGRGLVPFPGIVPQGKEVFRVGEPILLKRPDGSTLEWRIGGIEFIHTPMPRDDFSILLKDLGKEEIPIGTEVWSVERT